ncbi:hypothetical protein J2TS6_16880 [Paenibacillus albilobatus]|uniref:Uncharacterized protein n=1 Tax=Paenibacillus albilobatus TaxID=2716884 RepID=A0A919XGU8_9BACL|nr:hypothetical protein J2TS6_16880 [Paenibacillus albilobatus]
MPLSRFRAQLSPCKAEHMGLMCHAKTSPLKGCTGFQAGQTTAEDDLILKHSLYETLNLQAGRHGSGLQRENAAVEG